MDSTTKEEDGSVDLFDVAAKQRSQLDLLFALKRSNLRPALPRDTYRLVKDKILHSPELRKVIQKLVEDGRGQEGQLLTEAGLVLDEMTTEFKMSSVRLLSFIFAKLIRNLYQSLTINLDGIEKLRSALSKGPVLVLPTHRSYADFILISYLFFTLDLPLPIIAAGMDFKAMKLASRLIQDAGGFFIRRSFRHDLLYWTIISEYIRHHVVHYQAPLEFFIEGTRSRVGKSLPPKTGLLSMALDPYLSGEVADIQIVTVSISFERTLEENLYAYEVLGVPKPKESTAGFFNAVDKLRGENFGRIYVHIDEPVPVSQHLRRRPVSAWYRPPTYSDPLQEAEQARQLRRLSLSVVRRQQRSAVTPVFVVLATLLTSPGDQKTGLDLDRLVQRFNSLNRLVAGYAKPCQLNGKDDVRRVIVECLSVHSLKISSNDGVYRYPCDVHLAHDMQERAAARLVLQGYTNQLLTNLINVALLAFVKDACCIDEPAALVERSRRVAGHLTEEFVMIDAGPSGDDVTALQATDPAVAAAVAALVRPYVQGLYLLIELLRTGPTPADGRHLTGRYRAAAARLVETGATELAEILAIDKIGRSLFNLVQDGRLRRTKTAAGDSVFHVVDLQPVLDDLGPCVDAGFAAGVAACCLPASSVASKL